MAPILRLALLATIVAITSALPTPSTYGKFKLLLLNSDSARTIYRLTSFVFLQTQSQQSPSTSSEPQMARSITVCLPPATGMLSFLLS
jgi:hypothetical protein